MSHVYWTNHNSRNCPYVLKRCSVVFIPTIPVDLRYSFIKKKTLILCKKWRAYHLHTRWNASVENGIAFILPPVDSLPTIDASRPFYPITWYNAPQISRGCSGNKYCTYSLRYMACACQLKRQLISHSHVPPFLVEPLNTPSRPVIVNELHPMQTSVLR